MSARKPRSNRQGGWPVKLDIDPPSEGIGSPREQADRNSLKRFIETHPGTAKLTVPRGQVKDVNELMEGGAIKINDASNPVFIVDNYVVKFVSMERKDTRFFRALALEVDVLMSTCPFWVGVEGLFLRGSNLCMVMDKMIVMAHFAEVMYAKNMRMPDGVLAKILHDLLEGLKRLQALGLLHGDVKSGNIVFDPKSMHWRLNDFGSIGKHLKKTEYEEEYGLSPEMRCTKGFRLTTDYQNEDIEIDNRVDILALYFTILAMLLGNKHPMTLLSSMKDFEIGVQEYEFTNMYLQHSNLLQALVNEGVLQEIKDTTLRIVLQQMGHPDYDSRVRPSKAVELLAPSAATRTEMSAFVSSVLDVPKQYTSEKVD